MTLDTFFSSLGLVLESALVVVLIRGRVYKAFPFFCLFMAESAITAFIMFFMINRLTKTEYYYAFLVDFSISSILQVALLAEILWGSLKPLRASLPRYSLAILVCMLLLTSAILWPIVGLTDPPNLDRMGSAYFHILKIIAVLRVGIFVVMVGFSKLLAIGWKNRELQISTGLGFYSLIFLVITLLHTYHPVEPMVYHVYDQLIVLSFILCLIYWLLSFLKEEPVRIINTAQMEKTLLLLGGAVKSYRVAVTKSIVTKQDEPREP